MFKTFQMKSEMKSQRRTLTTDWGLRQYLLFLLFAILGQSLSAQDRGAIDIIKKAERQTKSRIGVEIRRCRDDSLFVSNRRDEQFCPASLVKLVTSASILRLRGTEIPFYTGVGMDGKIRKGILDGNLIIKGGGDPSLASNYLPTDSGRFAYALVDAVKQWGIKEITGDIIVDASAFDIEGVNDSWLDEDKGNYFGAGVYGFNINDNRIDVILATGKTGSEAHILRIEPPHPEVRWENRIEVIHRGKDTAGCYGEGLDLKRTLTGVLPTNIVSYRLKTDLPDPALYGAAWAKGLLSAAGTLCQGKCCASYQAVPITQELLICESLPLDSLVRVMNFRSLNHFAEAFVKQLAPLASKNHRGNTTERGLSVIRNYWTSQTGLQHTDISLSDGSGLSRKNRFSPNALSQILIDMISRGDLVTTSFLNSLPLAGREGTVKNFMKDEAIEAYLKSGSMKGVLGYAGYVRFQREWYSVVLMGNDFSSSAPVRRAFSDFLLSFFSSATSTKQVLLKEK